MTQIVKFIRDRLQEDEDAARAAEGSAWTYAEADLSGGGDWIVKDEDDFLVFAAINMRTARSAVHVARHDPERALREVEAKRAIVDLGICLACDVEMQPCDHREDTLRALAAVYSDHPLYQEAWKP